MSLKTETMGFNIMKGLIMEDKEMKQKLEALYKILLGMNAFGSLDLQDMFIIENYLKSAFNFDCSQVDFD